MLRLVFRYKAGFCINGNVFRPTLPVLSLARYKKRFFAVVAECESGLNLLVAFCVGATAGIWNGKVSIGIGSICITEKCCELIFPGDELCSCSEI